MNRIERSSRRRSRKPLFIFFMVLASGLLIGTAALTVGDSWLLGPGFIYPNSSLSNNVVVNGTLRVFGQHVCLENGSYCPASSGNGSAGPAGTNGTDGINGTRWTLNTSFPNSPNINDSFLNTSTGVYWQWTGSSWVQKGNLTGPKGAQGETGPNGDPGPQGATGDPGQNGTNGTGIASIYLLANGSLQINLTSGVNTTSGNLSGPKGDQGVQGIQGEQGVQGIPGIGGTNGTNGTNGLNGTGIKDIYLLLNGSLQINLTNGTNITTANITGATGATGQAGTNGSNASVTSGDLYINITNGIVRANITHFDLRYYLSSNPDSYTTLAAVVAAIQNATICHTDGTNCPPAGGGNSSWNESRARELFPTNGSSARLITLNATNVNVSGITATERLLVGAQSTGDPSEVYVESTNARMRFNDTDGLTMQFRSQANVFSIQQVGGSSKFAFAFNSTTEKVGILTTAPTSELTVAGDTNVSGVIYGGSATLGGLTTTSDATIQGVLVVDPGTATAAAVRVGGPLTTYSALQFQSEQNRTRDFIFSSVNNSVASNRMAFRVTGNEAGANAGGDLSVLRFDDSGAFIDTIMKIDRSDGYVGIGDTTPDAKLDVLGNTILDGDLNVTGTVYVTGDVYAQPTNISYAPAFRDILYAAGPAGVSITGMNATARCSSFPVEDNTRLVFDNIKFMVDKTNSSVGVYVAIYNCTSANKFDCTSGTLLINQSKTALSSTAMQGPTNTTGNWTLPSGNYVSCTSTNVTNSQSGVLRGTTGSAGTGSTLRLTITRGAFPQSASFTASESDGVPYVYLYRAAGVVS